MLSVLGLISALAALQEIGQPVLIGGSMGTASYVLTGTEEAMRQSFGSTSHGAGRALSRSKALKQIDSQVGWRWALPLQPGEYQPIPAAAYVETRQCTPAAVPALKRSSK